MAMKAVICLCVFFFVSTRALHLPAGLEMISHQLPHVLGYLNIMLPLEVPVSVEPEPVVEAAKGVAMFDFSKLPDVDLSNGLQAFIQKNPEWGGSTSAYIKNLVDGDSPFAYLKFLYDPFTDVREGVNGLLKDSEFASTGTSKYLADSFTSLFKNGPGKALENVIQANPELQQSTSSYLTEGFKSSFKNGPGKAVEAWIAENPELQQSTSAWVTKYYETVVAPKAAETGEFLGRSPLVTDTKGLFSKSTTEFLGVFYDKFRTASEPTLGPVSRGLDDFFVNKFGGQVGKTFQAGLDANPDLKLSTSEYLGKLLGGGSSSLDQAIKTDFGLTPEQQQASTSTYASKATAGATDAVNKALEATARSLDVGAAVDSLSKTASAAPEALSRAGSTFSSQLTEKGDVLLSNTLGGLEATGKGILSIQEGIVNIGVPKVVEGTSKVANFVTDATTGGAQSISDSVDKISSISEDPSKVIEVDPRIVEKFNSFGNKVTSWKLFTDDNHNENGFWENAIKNTAKLASDTSEKVQTPDFWDGVNKNVEKLGADAGGAVDEAVTRAGSVADRVGYEWNVRAEQAGKVAEMNIKQAAEVAQEAQSAAQAASNAAQEAAAKASLNK